MFNVKIHQSRILGGGAEVVASINHPVHATPEKGVLLSRLRDLAQNNMYALAGSFSVIDKSPNRTLVRGFMIPTKDILPVGSEMPANMQSLSRNTYMDDQDNIWRLEKNAEGNFLVRANKIDDPAEIASMMKACCSAVAPGTDNYYFSALAGCQKGIEGVQGGDAALYVQAGELRFGVVAATVVGEDGQEALYIATASEDVDCIDRSQVVNAIAVGTQVEGSELAIPGEAEALANAQAIETLVSYWQKVYGFNPEYFSKLEAIIRGHSFA